MHSSPRPLDLASAMPPMKIILEHRSSSWNCTQSVSTVSGRSRHTIESRLHTLPVLKFIGQLCHKDHVGGLDRLLLEKSNAKGIAGVVFGVFKMWDGEFGIVNWDGSVSPPVRSSNPRQLTRMNERCLLTQSSPELEAFQCTRGVFAKVDEGVA